MKQLISLLLLLTSQLGQSQIDNLITIEPFAVDSIVIDRSMLLTTMTIKPKRWWRSSSEDSYEGFLQRAIDSTFSKNGNVLKVLDFTYDSNSFSSGANMKIEMYYVNDSIYDRVNLRQQKIEKMHKIRIEELSWVRKQSVNKYDNCWYAENRFRDFRSIPRDSTTGKYLEVGVSAGSDVLLVGLNLHTNIEFYLLNTPYAKISLSNKAGLMLVPIGEYYITYTSPGIKFSVPIKNIWLTATLGKEYLRYHVNDENYSGIKTDVIDKRIDFGLKLYKTKSTSVEVYYPLRLDDEVIPWWTGGLVFSMNYRI